MGEEEILRHAVAIERLASVIHRVLERLDPSDEAEWEALSPALRELYSAATRELLRELPDERQLLLALCRGADARPQR